MCAKNHSSLFLFAIVSILIGSCISQHYYDCPQQWQLFENHCYHFVFFPKLNYDSARLKCSFNGAALVSVNSFPEHSFITGWLSSQDSFQRSWFTSGMRKFKGSLEIEWKGDGTDALPNAQFWLPERQDNTTGDGVIAYVYDVAGYGWEMVSPSDKLSYICEIKQAEAYRIVQHERDFDYGIKEADLNNLERGPVFTLQPSSTIIVNGVIDTTLECVAFGNPSPIFKWFKVSKGSRVEVTSATSNRYTLTNGKLTISNSNENEDAGDYQCEASNKFGTIISNTAVISFGRLGEFSNVPDDAVRATAYEGVAIQCSQITARPAARYQWMKFDSRAFVRTELNPHMFVSANGKLYFSEVTDPDHGEYRCMAELTGINKHAIGASQVPRRSSLPIQLIVNDNTPKAEWGPEIQNDFLAVFPQPPIRGSDVRIECFAYGTSKVIFTYKWSRKDGHMPHKTKYYDHNRIIIIPDAQLEDQGEYTCRVSRGNAASDEKSLVLRLGAKPYFIANLQNQHVDVGAQLTWRCEVTANPPATYTWYKDGDPLEPIPGEMTVNDNVLTIESLNAKKHNGMYQCGAANTHGEIFSSAQLRVLSFAPNFNRFPMDKISGGSQNGNITLMCKPEGAPTPEITWLKNGSPLTVGAGSHYEQLANGFLFISNLGPGDEGQYSCKAINILGEAQESVWVKVTSGTKIVLPPSNTPVNVNSTAFMYCEASHDPNLEMVYTWKFNGHVLRNGYDPHILIESGQLRKGLYIMSAQLRHRGVYECSSVTPLDSDTRSAYLSVFGPPGEPGGVYIDDDIITKDSLHIRWTPGAANGRVISYYIIESRTEHDDEWKVALSSILEPDTIVNGEHKRSAVVTNLNPGVSYYFRVRAANAYGVGPPSLPSAGASTPSAPPTKPVENVRGGGGSVGDLTIIWDKLTQDEQGGSGIGYNVYWRKLDDRYGLWRKARVGNVDEHIETVGEANYYLEYEVKVEAYNDEGRGSNSSTEVIFSAADMPKLTPTNVESDTYNGTAIEVSWEPIEDRRETAKGKILGYQINYWPDEGDYWLMFVRHEGQRDTGLVIGLESDQNFWVDVQMYNSAGLGPRSEAFVMETSRLPTNSFPEEVRVFSHGEASARVWWRGITTTYDEALITGYRVYYWEARETFMAHKFYDTIDHTVTEAIIEDLEKNVVYSLRVGGMSAAGEGKKSPTQYFTLGGQIQMDDLMAKSIQGFKAGSSIITVSLTAIFTGLCLALNLK